MQETRKPKDDAVYLIDGSGYIFRAYYAVRPLTSSKGVPTNAVYGFTSMLLKLLKEHHPKYLAIAFDTGKPTFRHKLYSEYKAHRPPPPEDLIPQFDLIHRLVDAFKIRRLVQEGYEADDLLGTATRVAREENRDVVIVTGDKDMMQLVGEGVWVLNELRATRSGQEQLIGPSGVVDKFGVGPEYVVDILALAGDSSDNVPGVRGIGEKTAAELVKEYGHLETILNSAPLMKQKSRREKLMSEAELARLSMQLVTIDRHVSGNWDMSGFSYNGPDYSAIKALFTELDFKRLLHDPLIGEPGEQAPSAARSDSKSVIDRSKYRLITDEHSLEELVGKMRTCERIAIDTETDSLNSLLSKLVGISLSYSQGEAVYIPVGHDAEIAPHQLTLDKVRQKLEPLLQNPKIQVVAQNAKFDRQVLEHAGFKPFHISGDPMLASYLLDADLARHSLDELSKRYLDHSNISFEEVCGTGKNQISFAKVPLERATEYSAEDADVTFRLSQILEEKLGEAKLTELYRELEIPLEEVLCRMEQAGILIDVGLLSKMSLEFEAKLHKLEKEAFNAAGMEFNLGSPKQVGDVLFGKLGLDPVKKTKTGQSTDASVLEALQYQHPLPKILLEHRLISKLKNTYIDTLPLLINPETGRVHTSFNQAVAATGRLSSSDPNLQNIPIRSPEGRRIREAFVAKEGCVLVSLDYSQVELRILAHVSGDLVMLDAFRKGEDVHQRTASEICGVPLAEVTKEQRNLAKTINFGLMYGMGPHRLAQTVGISRAEANDYLKRYYERYAGIYEWQRGALTKAHEEKRVYTLLGRVRSLPDLDSKNRVLVQRAERIAINAPIQGTAADMIKRAMILVDRKLQEQYPQARMLLQVHDELLIEVPKEQSVQVTNLVKAQMIEAMPLSVPIVVETGEGHSWAQAH